ncbi:protein kinase domain-containing protein [Embleya sp. NBC_00896]|uniref:serine/threonine-protein kinase n=1 Tax=Embleya sp. NBC_00896 TaxID=2975961 RepID=UPI00387038D2|nr:serine/threonine-protein kinase [Embleya sp. NBC_00896]
MEELRDGDPMRLGPYRLRARLGEGGMGEVFLGISPSGVRVAVKTVRPEFAMDHGFRDRFRREIDLARRVDSAWTAPIAEADPDAQPPWLATEYLTGLSLSAAIGTYGPLPEDALRILGAQLAEALMAIHRAGLIHRDLKPSNVVLGRDRLRVIDFGISRAADEGGAGLTGTGRVVGSPSFMSPEQAGGRRLGPESDVFSLGSVLVFAATGRGPFHGDPVPQLQMMMRVLRDEPDTADVPEGIRHLILECLRKEPEGRPKLAEILDRCVGDGELPTGRSWLPAALAAELERRHVSDPMAPVSSIASDPPAASAPTSADSPASGDEPPTRALGIGTEPTAAATETAAGALSSDLPRTRIAPPPLPDLPPTVGMPQAPIPKRTLARRGFLIGGGALAVVAVGGGTGWLLMGDESDPGKQVWDYPAEAAGASSLAAQGDLVYHVANGAGGGAGQVTAIDATSGKQIWKRPTAGQTVSNALVTRDHVFVVSWTVAGSGNRESSQPKICTVHAFDPIQGEQRWTLEYEARWVNLPAALDEGRLYLGIAEENSYSTDPGRIVAVEASTHKVLWESVLTKEHGNPGTPIFAEGRIYALSQGNTSSDGSMIRAVDKVGRFLWDVPFKETTWGRDPVMHKNRLLVLVADSASSGVYTWQRFGVDAVQGTQLWGPIAFKGGNTGDLVLADATAFVAYNGADDLSRSGVVAIDPYNGDELWKYEMPARYVTEPVRVGDLVIFGARPSSAQAGVLPGTSATATATPTAPTATTVATGTIHALDASSGVVVWTQPMPSFGTLGGPVVESGKVYVSVDATDTSKARLIALGVKSGKVDWEAELSSPLSSRPVRAKGSVYVAHWRKPDAGKQASTVSAFEE